MNLEQEQDNKNRTQELDHPVVEQLSRTTSFSGYRSPKELELDSPVESEEEELELEETELLPSVIDTKQVEN